MKPGEYIVLGFLILMLTAFFSVFIWFLIKRMKKQKAKKEQA